MPKEVGPTAQLHDPELIARIAAEVLGLLGSRLALAEGPNLTISGGVITVTHPIHQVDTEGGAGTDDLDTINGLANNQILILYTVVNTRDVTLRNGVGNLNIGTNFTLANRVDKIGLFRRSATAWDQLFRSTN